MLSTLIVEDDDRTRFALAEFTEGLGFATATAASFDEARAELGRSRPSLVLLDMYLPGGSGIDLLLEMPSPRPHVLLMSGDESIQRAVEQMSLQTVHFLRKPVVLDLLKQQLDAVKRQAPRSGSAAKRRVGRLVGESRQLSEVMALIEKVAPTDVPVYIEGESGTGKELIAEAVHLHSNRSKGPFVAVNCGALPESLVDSEIFGHERGAFTGAAAAKPGVFEQADGGTLFLDEISEMPAELQVRLLRVLETAKVKRVGGTREIEVDVRVIAATHRPAEQAVREGKLREDLLHRLCVFPIYVPPLRARDGDIEVLVRHFLAQLSEAEGKAKRIDDAALQALMNYRWPGNVRQLRNAVQRACIVADSDVTLACLPPQIRVATAPGADLPVATGPMRLEIGMTVADAERRLIEATLQDRGGDKRAAADVLGISLRTLYNRLREYGAADGE